jgi:DNA-binding NarL/FixJ family response regulator
LIGFQESGSGSIARVVEAVRGRSGKSGYVETMRVLIADGQKDVGISLAALVERCGHEVLLVVGSGLEAIQAYARLKPDVVLMDYSLPRFNAVIASRLILAKDPQARIVIVSAASPPPAATNSIACAILSKPIELDKLYGALYDAGSGKPKPTSMHD